MFQSLMHMLSRFVFFNKPALLKNYLKNGIEGVLGNKMTIFDEVNWFNSTVFENFKALVILQISLC